MENKRYKEIKIFKSNVLVKRVFFLLNAAFAMAILDLISHVHLPSFVNKLPKYLKHFHILQLFLVYHNCYWGRLA